MLTTPKVRFTVIEGQSAAIFQSPKQPIILSFSLVIPQFYVAISKKNTSYQISNIAYVVILAH